MNDRQFIVTLIRGCFAGVFIFMLVLLGAIQLPTGIDLNQQTTSVVTKADGTVLEFDSEVFGVVNKGDDVVIDVHLPQDQKHENYALTFYIYHSITTVTYQDQVLYEYGQDIYDEGKMIGAEYPIVLIPEEAWGNVIQIHFQVTEDAAFSRLNNLMAYPAESAYTYVIHNSFVTFIVSICGITLGLIMGAVFFAYSLKDKNNRKGLYISLFMILASTWMMTRSGIYTIFSHAQIWQNIEFYSLYLVSFPILLYFLEEPLTEKAHKITLILTIIEAIFFTVAYFLDLFHIVHINVLLTYFHVLILTNAILLLFFVHRKSVYRVAPQNRFMMVGFWILITFSILDVVKFNAERFIAELLGISSQSVMPVGFTAFVVFMILSYIEEIRGIEKFKQDQIVLSKLAYRDPLTGLNNRARMDSILENLQEGEGEDRYAILSLDMNYLKYTNDHSGHQVGDELLCAFARILLLVFDKIGQVARIGGDEFIVVVTGNRISSMDEYCRNLDKEIADYNRRNTNSKFILSCSYGYSVHTSADSTTVEQVQNEADMNMYRMKAQQHRDHPITE